MRQEPLEITPVLFGDVRAGRAAARSFVLGAKGSARERRSLKRLLSVATGLTATIPAASGVMGRRGNLPPLFVPHEERAGAEPCLGQADRE